MLQGFFAYFLSLKESKCNLTPGRCPETHKRSFLKKAPLDSAKTLPMGLTKPHCFCKPMLPCAVGAFP